MPPKAHCGPERTSCGRVITAARPGRWFRRFSHNPQYRVCHHPPRLKRTRDRPCTCQASLVEVLAFVPGVCFDRQCQEAADKAFLIVTAVPLLGLLAAIILRFRPASTEELNSEQVAAFHASPHTANFTMYAATAQASPPAMQQVFDDPATGLYFQSQDGSIPERDKKGELAFRPISYTPWPVEAGTPGERLRIDVGPALRTSPRTFVFDR